MRLRCRAILAVVTAALLVAGAPVALAAKAPAREIVVHGVDSSAYPEVKLEVSLPADMLDEQGTAQPAFTVSENGEQRPVVGSSRTEQQAASVNVVLLIDISGSMRGKPLQDAQTAAHRFLSEIGPTIPVAIVAISSEPKIVTPFTTDRAVLGRGVDSLMSTGQTAVYDSLASAARMLSLTGSGRRVAVLLSDGGDTTSVRSLDTTIKTLKDTHSVVLALGLVSEDLNKHVLQLLADETGGRNVSVADSSQLSDQYAALAREFNNVFTLSYRSAKPETKDVEIDITAQAQGHKAQASTAFPNPRFGTETVEVGGTGLEVPSNAPAYLVGAILAFGAAVVILVLSGLLALINRRSGLDQLRFYEQLQQESASQLNQQGDVRAKVVDAVGAIAGTRGFTQLISEKLERAALPLRPAEYITAHVAAVVIIGFLVQILGRNIPLSILTIVLLAIGPLLLLERQGRKRTEAFDTQMPDVLNLLAGGLRTGWGLQQALDLVVNEAAAPASVEFHRVQIETRLGVPIEQALQAVAERLRSQQFEWVVVAVAIQREVGGNLAEVLDNVARSIRDREALQRQVEALSAEGKLSAVILTILPLVVGVGMWAVRPDYMMTAIGSPLGVAMFVAAGVLLIVGLIWLKRISRIEY